MSVAADKSVRLTGPQRREQLLDVTRAIVGERGFHAVTIDAVARRAGITRPVVYNHFDDLSGLLHALVEREGARALVQLMELLPRAGSSSEEPTEMLLGALRAFLEAVRADPVTWALVLVPQQGTPTVLHEQIARTRRAVTEQLARVAPEALVAGGLPGPPDPELTARTLQAVAEELARALLEEPEAFPVERLLDHARWALRLIGS